MMFWKRKSKIVVDCFTNLAIVAEDHPIEKASSFIPNWWKNLPHYNTYTNEVGIEVPSGTMKGCLGFIDLYGVGFVVPLWADLIIKIEENKFTYQLGRSDAFGKIIYHQPNQYNNRFNNHVHFKITAPWFIKEKTGVKFLMTPCSWTSIEETPKLNFLNGILNFDKNHECNVNGFALQENMPYQYNLKAGFPLTHIIPMTEKSVDIKIHHVDSQEWDKLKTLMPNKFYSWGLSRRKTQNQKK